MWALLLVGCGVGEWVSEKTKPAPPPAEVTTQPHVIQPPQPLPSSVQPAQSDSRPQPPPSPIAEANCHDVVDGGDVNGPGCLTAVIKCDQTVIGNTVGGVDLYDTKWYEAHQCTPAVTNHDGGDERVYRLDVPEGDWSAFVTMYSPCADLDVAAYLWTDSGCPPQDAPTGRCEENRVAGRQDERLTLVTQHQASWYIVVEGVDEQEGLFALTVQCRPRLW
jgi:hypothetical protein